MQEKYREAVDQASQILVKALIEDIENVVEQGKFLDKAVAQHAGHSVEERLSAAGGRYRIVRCYST